MGNKSNVSFQISDSGTADGLQKTTANSWSSSPPTATPQSPPTRYFHTLTPTHPHSVPINLSQANPKDTQLLVGSQFNPELKPRRTQEGHRCTGINLEVCRPWTKLRMAHLKVEPTHSSGCSELAAARTTWQLWWVCSLTVWHMCTLRWGTQDLFSSHCLCHFPFWLDECSLQSPQRSATGLPLRHKSKRALTPKTQSRHVEESKTNAQHRKDLGSRPAKSPAVV